MIFDSAFREEIRTKCLQPSYRADIDEFLSSRMTSRKWAHRFELLGTFSSGLAGASSSASLAWTYFNAPGLYMSILFSTGSVILLTMAAFMTKRTHTNTEQLNKTLKSLGISAKLHDEIAESKPQTPRLNVEVQ